MRYSASSPDPLTPAAKGRRTPIALLYRRAEVEPDRLFGSFPLTDNVEDGFRDFTFAELANAVDACAWHLKDVYGTSDNFEPILYMGVNDYRYIILFYATIKCGYHCLFINPRYPIDGVMVVVDKMKCMKAFYSLEELPIIQDIQSRRPAFEARQLAQASTWLDALPEPFPFEKTWEESKWDPILSVHSSGTTGPPKPITYKNGYFASFDVHWPVPDGKRPVHAHDSVKECHLAFSIFPQFHSGGVFMNNTRVVYGAPPAVMLPSNANYIKSPEVALRILQLRPVDTLTAVPLLVENLCNIPGGIEAMRKLDSVLYGGGALRQDVAKRLSTEGVFTFNTFGTTEAGIIPGIALHDPEDSEYFHFNPNYKLVMEPVGDETGAAEMVVRKGKGEEEEELHQKRCIYWSLGVDEFRTKDLFVPHPTKPDLWKYYGRTDDILVLASAGKLNPIPLEAIVCGHPGISGALVAGEHRFPPCLLVEPVDKVVDHGYFIQEIWPQIEKANAQIRKEMRIPQSMVAIVEQNGLERGMKGQLIRKMNAQKHASLIDKLYEERMEAS